MKIYLVTDQKKDWDLPVDGVELLTSAEYLTQFQGHDSRSVRVFNLCRSYAYQESGYYVSLLAAARGHMVIPSVATVLEMKSQSLLRIRSQELDEKIQKAFKDLKSDEFTLSIYFGKNTTTKYNPIAAELHKAFNAPLLRAKFTKKDKWRLSNLSPIGLRDVPEGHKDTMQQFAKEYFTSRLRSQRLSKARFSLAILTDKQEDFAPSNERALQKFVQAAEKLQIETEFITKDDIGHLAEFDGLFIRATTAVNHYTFRFAQKAEALGLVVIDDPTSILRCTNKVYLAELFQRNKIPAPKTSLIHRYNLKETLAQLEVPTVLKTPDGSFSQGVLKVTNAEDLEKSVRSMLEHSDLIVAQEYLPTEFDWRIGVLGGEPIFACKYFMARNHWQIYKKSDSGKVVDGQSETFAIEQIPDKLRKLATRAAGLIGTGLYGLDIKEAAGKYYIIEINDNPNIDAGGEDRFLKDKLYTLVMKYFLEKMEARTQGRIR